MPRTTVFELSVVLFAIALLLIVAVPEVSMRDRERGEADAVLLLERFGVAEQGARAGPGAGSRSYRYLPDLLERTAITPDTPAEADSVRIGGYRFAVFLPDATGRPVPFSRRAEVDAASARRSFLLLAWPVVPGGTGIRPYAMDSRLVVFEHPGDLAGGSGPALPPPPFDVFDEDGPGTFPLPWRPLLPQILAKRMRSSLEEAGLPVPNTLDAILSP